LAEGCGFMVQFLADGQAIKREVQRVFNDETGRRVALVAFVGDNAQAFLPKPAGLHLVCWPKASGTNPKAIAALVRRKVKVEFADRLHMKVYWAEQQGAVVASANLSTNAYGAGFLHEAGVLLPSSAVDIDDLLQTIKPKPVTSDAFAKLQADWVAASKVQAGSRRRSQAKSFLDWLPDHKRSPWLLHCFDDYGGGASRRLRSVAKEETGKSKVQDWIYCRKGELKSEDFVLCVDLKSKRKPLVDRWFFTHQVVLVSRDDNNYNADWPFQAGQLYRDVACPPPPFDIDLLFRRALRAAYKDLEATSDEFSIDRTALPSKNLRRLLEKHYRALSPI
jgi:hypothetical protein